MATPFGTIIREKRKTLHFSQEKVARLAEISHRSILNIEKGLPCTTDVLYSVCDALGLEIIFRDKEEA